MYAKLPRFIAASRHYAPIAGAAHKNRFVFKPAILLALYGYEKGIQVKM